MLSQGSFFHEKVVMKAFVVVGHYKSEYGCCVDVRIWTICRGNLHRTKEHHALRYGASEFRTAPDYCYVIVPAYCKCASNGVPTRDYAPE